MMLLQKSKLHYVAPDIFTSQFETDCVLSVSNENWFNDKSKWEEWE